MIHLTYYYIIQRAKMPKTFQFQINNIYRLAIHNNMLFAYYLKYLYLPDLAVYTQINWKFSSIYSRKTKTWFFCHSIRETRVVTLNNKHATINIYIYFNTRIYIIVHNVSHIISLYRVMLTNRGCNRFNTTHNQYKIIIILCHVSIYATPRSTTL